MSKKVRLILAVFGCALIVANIAPVLIFNDAAKISQFSIPAIALMLLCAANAVVSCILMRKGNFLYFRKIHPGVLSGDKEYTFTEKYEKKFYSMLAVYCAAIPFYIPLIFFVSNRQQALWSLLVFAIPQLIFIAQDIAATIKDVKQHKIERRKREQELKKQMQNEELGRFK